MRWKSSCFGLPLITSDPSVLNNSNDRKNLSITGNGDDEILSRKEALRKKGLNVFQMLMKISMAITRTLKNICTGSENILRNMIWISRGKRFLQASSSFFFKSDIGNFKKLSLQKFVIG